MAGHLCPYCNQFMAVNDSVLQKRYLSFNYVTKHLDDSTHKTGPSGMINPDTNKEYHNFYDELIEVLIYRCPNSDCGKFSIYLNGIGNEVRNIHMTIKPTSSAKIFPDYIPEQLRIDYEEAYKILYLSPKASATLSRRCLQGMIRDYWCISEKTLYAEITKLKDKIPIDLWNVINSVRQLGNIGAHMEKDINLIVDIDSDEAENLIKLIELLFKEWYIAREERNRLFSDIVNTNSTKQEERKSQSS